MIFCQIIGAQLCRHYYYFLLLCSFFFLNHSQLSLVSFLAQPFLPQTLAKHSSCRILAREVSLRWKQWISFNFCRASCWGEQVGGALIYYRTQGLKSLQRVKQDFWISCMFSLVL